MGERDNLTIDNLMKLLKERDPHQEEFHQAVQEVMQWVVPFAADSSRYNSFTLFEKLTEPERIIQFRVPWLTDKGEERCNRGFRIQFNSAIGPYKGGLRFHPTVNLSILKFLGFEQTFKNSLTGLPLGGGKGGSDFNPRGRSEAEIMRFCQSFMNELFRHIGPDTDIPAGDAGVGTREIGFLFGHYKRLTAQFNGVITGKSPAFGGSLLRPEATGFGLLYFTKHMMKQAGKEVDDARILISGSGNVAQYACMKAIETGAKVLTMSDSDGYIFVKDGLSREQLNTVMDIKNNRRGRIRECTEEFECDFHEGTPWEVEADIALPCATQNEIDKKAAKSLIGNDVVCVAEGANMPCTSDAVAAFHDAGVLFAPGKASNAGGVSVSGLEMTQNAQRLSWDKETVDQELHDIMDRIHDECVEYGREDKHVNYEKGAAIAGFIKVADAMLAQGAV